MAATTNKVTAEHLEPEHHDAFSKAVHTILADPLTETTMAQLVDGLPEVLIAREAAGNFLTVHHPLSAHDELCEGVLEKTRAFRDNFVPNMLFFDSHLLQAYAESTVGTAIFHMRLIEMVAVSIHQIAVALFNLTPKSHSPEYIKSVVEWQEPTGWVQYCGRKRWQEPIYAPRPTPFFHSSYLDHDLYPNGLADVAGYWAEDRILGGVVVFDRGMSGKECEDLFFHSGRIGETFRIWRPLDSQRKLLIDFLLARSPDSDFLLPLLATDRNTYRFDPWDAIALHRIFRDPWERRVPLEKPPERDVRSTGDYPELAEWAEGIYETAETGSQTTWREPTPVTPKVDQTWIYAFGGHMGEPLGRRMLPQTGPPEDEGVEENDPGDTGNVSRRGSVSSLEKLYQDGLFSTNVDNLLDNALRSDLRRADAGGSDDIEWLVIGDSPIRNDAAENANEEEVEGRRCEIECSSPASKSKNLRG